MSISVKVRLLQLAGRRRRLCLFVLSPHARNKLGSGNSFGTSAKRCELSWTGPIERNVLARIRCPLKLEAERIDGTHHRLAQVTSCPGPVSEPGGFMSCGYFPGRLVGPVRALAQAFTLPAISVPH